MAQQLPPNIRQGLQQAQAAQFLHAQKTAQQQAISEQLQHQDHIMIRGIIADVAKTMFYKLLDEAEFVQPEDDKDLEGIARRAARIATMTAFVLGEELGIVSRRPSAPEEEELTSGEDEQEAGPTIALP